MKNQKPSKRKGGAAVAGAAPCSASWDKFMISIARAKCPICQAPMSDDGCDSNPVFRDQEGVLWEYYNGPWRYGHQTVACRNHHHFTVADARIAGHIENLEGISRGWVLHDLMPNNQGEPQPPTTGVADRKNV